MRTILLATWAVGILGLLGLNLLWPLPGQEGIWPWVTGMAAFPIAAFLLLVRRPGNGVGLAMAAVASATGWIFLLAWYAVTFPTAVASEVAEALAGIGYVVQFAGLAALLHVFPTGRPMAGWHARLFWGAMWLVAILAVLMPLRPGPLDVTGRPNPLGVAGLAPMADAGFGIVALVALTGLVVLVVRWRRAGPVERQQFKWFLTGAVAVVVLFVVLLTGVLRADPFRELLGGVFAVAAFWSLPAALVIAITRHRLYEIDRLLSRSITYGVVVGVLLAVYVGGVLLLRGLLPWEGDLPVAVSTLAVAALFNPLRRRVQVQVDRQFNRTRYDAERELGLFSGRLRDELELETLGFELVTTAAQTMEPTHVSLWQRSRAGRV